MRNRLLPKFVVSVWSLALITMGGGLWGQFLAPSTTQAAELGATCVSCHEKLVASFKSSFHAKIWQGKNDCQSCHGATDKHEKDPSKQTIISFNNMGGRTPEELSKQCLSCHKKSEHLANWDMGEHKKNDVTCVACHTIHTPRFTVNQPEVCFNCHKDVRSDVNKMSHHPIIEGKVMCSDCHNTHGTLTKHMINAENNNQLCYKCHADKRGPWIWEHPPVEENCAICHTPHGSRQPNLLVERVFTLCQDCHTDHVPIDNKLSFTNDQTDSKRTVGRACLNCHHSIHGSSNFRRSFSR